MGEMSPARASRSTSFVRLEGLPGPLSGAACVSEAGQVPETRADASGPWLAQATASPLEGDRDGTPVSRAAGDGESAAASPRAS